MAEFQDSPLTVRFPDLGRETQRVESFSIDSDYLTSTDGFSVKLFDSYEGGGNVDTNLLLGLEMQPVELLVNGAVQLIGRVDQTVITDRSITINGRDYLSDLVECNVDPGLKFSAGETLGDALTLAFSPVGINSIVSDGDFALRDFRTGKALGAPPLADFKALTVEDYKANAGEGLYEFGNRVVARFGCTMQPANARNVLLLTAPNYEQEATFHINVSDEDGKRAGNNVITATATRDFSSFPTWTLFSGWNAGTGKLGKGSKKAVDPLGLMWTEYDMLTLAESFSPELRDILRGQCHEGRIKPGGTKEAVKLYRLLYLRDDNSRGDAQLEKAALRALSERLKDTLVYECTVKGHVDPISGAVWSTDTICRVDDDIRNVHELMWICSRTLSYGREGATTNLKMWRKGVFQV